jgi:putative glutamine amidotransferase
VPQALHYNGVHQVDVVRGSRLHAIVGREEIEVSSYHHQAIDVLGEGLIVTAVADDGLIEACEHQQADIVAVQWHPEDRHASSDTDAALFADLVDRARKRKDSP